MIIINSTIDEKTTVFKSSIINLVGFYGEKESGFVNQGMVKKRCGVKFYALAVSILVHVLALSIFAAVKFTQSPPAPSSQTTAVVSISQASALADRSYITPKPKVSPTEQGRPIIKAAGQGPSTNVRAVFEPPGQDSQLPMSYTESSQVYPKGSVDNQATTAQVEFFDSPAQGRRICYVVDCSGSMQGLWQPAKAELFESIGQLQPDQYFSVIVFGAGSILESGGGWMVRATEKAKKEAYEFIGSVQPRGTTNAAAALEHAIKIRDRSGVAPSVIYFLTDGFELSEQGNLRFAHQIETMLKNFSPKTRINTIGFWSDERDSSLLEKIARQSGGQFTLAGQTGEQ